MLRTSQPGETGLGPNTPSTCTLECAINYYQYYFCYRSNPEAAGSQSQLPGGQRATGAGCRVPQGSGISPDRTGFGGLQFWVSVCEATHGHVARLDIVAAAHTVVEQSGLAR